MRVKRKDGGKSASVGEKKGKFCRGLGKPAYGQRYLQACRLQNSARWAEWLRQATHCASGELQKEKTMTKGERGEKRKNPDCGWRFWECGLVAAGDADADVEAAIQTAGFGAETP